MLTYWYPSKASAALVSSRTGPLQRTYATMVYAGNFTLDATASGTAVQQFSLNNLEDVDITGGVGQPMHYDQLKVIYTRFQVYEVEYVFQMFNSVTNGVVAIGCADQTSAPSSARVLIENGGAQWRQLSFLNSTDVQRITMKGVISLPKLLGVDSKTFLDDDTYSTIPGTGVTDNMALNIALQELAGADPSAQQCYIELRYKVLCRGANYNASS